MAEYLHKQCVTKKLAHHTTEIQPVTKFQSITPFGIAHWICHVRRAKLDTRTDRTRNAVVKYADLQRW